MNIDNNSYTEKMNEQTFRICPYTKRELAKLYFPFTENAESAVANLRNLLKRNEDLMDELLDAGYNPYNKVFTPRQVRIIIHYLGEP